ncbi:MAG TPA: CPBP family intramembrane glutamic endopeptidase [Candidatus Sulfotelmatobacter sp.]|nr:CPBP family intramembrane glutamic endopeptidase [Candidatus Sulfotelmatobacter sp.]
MSSVKLTSSEKRALILWVLAGIAGLFFAQRYFFRAFPEASVDFKVSRPQAMTRAKDFIASLGENVAGYRTSVEFGVEEDAKVYLERELGLRQANQLMSSQLNLWYWNVRFYKPLEEREFRVQVSPSGKICGYTHVVPEATAGATLDRAAAQNTAQDFLTNKLGQNLGDWDFLSEQAASKKLPNRLDWDFTWEKRGFKAKDAPYRETIHIAGDKPTSASEVLQVPEEWRRGYERLRSGNNTLEIIFLVPYLLILGTAVRISFVLTKSGQTRWGLAIKLGAVAAGLLFLQELNNWPLWGAAYDTKESYVGFFLLQVLRALGMAIVTVLTITLVFPAAEPLYRESQPDKLRLSSAFTLRGMRTKEFFSAAVVGISMAAAHIGALVVFYMIASHYGAWAPQEVNYSDSVNTAFPWIAGIAIGLLASMNEEFTFRLFAIPFFTRVTKLRWIAVVVPAFLWGFLHSNYPQEPAYIRGLEVGLIGIVAGIVMLRWGILATLIWHYTVDASLVGLLLIRSDNPYFKISGVIVGLAAAAPLLFSLISYLRSGQFEPAEDLRNDAEPQPPISFETSEPSVSQPIISGRYQPIAGGAIAVFGICLVLGVVASLKLKQERIGDYLKLSVNAKQATTLADNTLRDRRLNPDAYIHVALFLNNSDPAANEFLREQIGVSATNRIYENQIPIALWGVRYFKDSDPEEYYVVLKPDGSLHSIHHTLPESAHGPSLSKEEATALGEKFLRQEKKVDLAGWLLVESKSKKQPHRTDHTLTWQQSVALDAGKNSNGQAFARMELQVLGDEVTSYRTYVKIPDEWIRKQEEQGLSRTLYFVGTLLAYVGLGAVMLVIYFKNFRTEDARSIPWKRISRWALWSIAGFVLVITFGDRFAQILQQYQTAIPLKAMYVLTAISIVLSGAFSVAALIFVFGLAWFFCKKAFGEEQLPNWTQMPGVYYRDALLIGTAGVSSLLGLESAIGWASVHWPTAHRSLPAVFGNDFSAKLPAGSVVGGAISHALLYSALLAAIGGFIAAYVRQWWLRVLLFLIGIATLVGDWGSSADFAKKYLLNVILVGAIVYGVRWIAKLNLLGIFLVIAASSLLGSALVLLKQPNAFYRGNAYVILAALGILFLWPLLKWQLNAKRTDA